MKSMGKIWRFCQNLKINFSFLKIPGKCFNKFHFPVVPKKDFVSISIWFLNEILNFYVT